MITPVILCGGSGTRLWPLSRKSYPKQFSKLTGETSLFQASALRVHGDGFAAPLVLTNSDFRFIVVEQLQAAGIDPGAVLIEPEGRNTAPAVLAAALHLHAQDPDALMLVLPSDHNIPDVASFRAAVIRGQAAAQAGDLVSFGITPTRPETGYGYLETAASQGDALKLLRFVEKPDRDTAQSMLDAGGYLWNAGIFLFTAQAVIDAFKTHRANLMQPVSDALTQAKTDLGFLRLDPASWADAEDISIDYAVMEPSKNLSAVPYDGGWSDLGDWDSVWREGGQGNVTHGDATQIDCTDTLLRADGDAVSMVGIGLDNIVAVATDDAVLVADKSRAQDVKLAVQALKDASNPRAETFSMDHRPWGNFTSLYIGDRFQVKRIVVKPDGILSLQSHVHRAEHWVVVEGSARVTLGDEEFLLSENQSVYIPVGEKHRLQNPGKVPLVLIEVQTGSYLGEDDIQRYEDVYARD